MTLPGNSSNLLKRVRLYAGIITLVWTACIATSLFWNLRAQSEKIAQIARISAQTVFENDVLYRHWVAAKGGVYVRVSEDTPPNPYLNLPERDVVTTSGLALTLMNPAYMTRQVHEMARKKSGSRGHITSLNPIRPENAADPWETAALQAFETGAKEVSSVEVIDGGESLRMMRPFIVEEACLKCHAAQGYKVGDIRGGISVSVPLGPLQAFAEQQAVNLALAHAALWLVGLTGIVFSKRSLGREISSRERSMEEALAAHRQAAEVSAHLRHEVAERKQAEQALRKNKERFEILAETAGRLLAADNPQEMVNQLCRRVMTYLDCQAFFNYLADDENHCLRLNAWAGIPDEAARQIQYLSYGVAVCGCAAQEGVRIVAENIRETCDPRTDLVRSFGIQAYACHPLLAGGRIIGTLSFGTSSRTTFSKDELSLMLAVADHVALAMERKQSEEALKEADRRKNEFLALLGHELRNPLAALSAAINLLKKEPTPERRQQSEGIIERQVRQLRRLVDDLLDVSRITRGKIQLQKEPLDIGEHMKRSAGALRSSLADRRISLWLTTPSAPVFVSADPVRLEQVFANLLSNAVKFTPNGGDIWFSAEKADGTVLIRCRDNGFGIAPEKISLIFEPFSQVDVELHRGDAGLGIGLALVKSLVEMHGGSVKAASDGSGKGSEFTVTLPAVEPPPRGEPVGVRPSSAGSVKRRILIAEDNTDLAQTLQMFLQGAGHEVIVVHDGDSAISAARREQPQVMLIDIGLPGRDGYAVAEEVKTMSPPEKTVLIGMSGYQQDHAKAAGCFDHYLVKPVDTDALLLLLDQDGEGAFCAGGSGQSPSGESRRILVVEDHPDLGAMTLNMLRDAGYEAVLAPDGESAVATAKTFHPHIVLCDLRLPGMSGFEVAQELRRDEPTKSAFIIALTAAEVQGCEPEIKAAGFDGAATKPLQMDLLQELLAQAGSAL